MRMRGARRGRDKHDEQGRKEGTTGAGEAQNGGTR